MNCVVFISLAKKVGTLEANSDTVFLDWTQSGQSVCKIFVISFIAQRNK